MRRRRVPGCIDEYPILLDRKGIRISLEAGRSDGLATGAQRIFGLAAELASYFLFALFPLILILVTAIWNVRLPAG
jgi:hypothetical protein